MIYFEEDEKVYGIEVPPVKNIRFEDWCEFRQHEAEYMETEMDYQLASKKLEKAMSFLISGDLDKVPIHITGDDPQVLIDRGWKIGIGKEISQHRLYAHIINTVNEYKPDRIPTTFNFRFGGMTFRVKRRPVARVLSDRPLTTGEALETLEFQRRATERMKTKPQDVGNIDFNLGLREFAILVRRPGEELPADETKRAQFIQERMELFKDLPMNLVFDLRFFFAHSLMTYTKTNYTLFSGRDLQVQIRLLKQRVRRSVNYWLTRLGRSLGGGRTTR